MKGVRYIVWLLVATTACCIHISFNPPVSNTSIIALAYANEFEKAAFELEAVATAFKFNKVGLDSLRASLCKTRLAYKKTECLLAYYYPEFIEEHINGAPVLHIERNDSRALVKE